MRAVRRSRWGTGASGAAWTVRGLAILGLPVWVGCGVLSALSVVYGETPGSDQRATETSSDLPAVQGEAAVRYQRDVLPILSQHCFPCHGPDEAQRRGRLRLDQAKANATDDTDRLDRLPDVVTPGAPDASELVTRIRSAFEDEVMPPPEFEHALSPAQIDTLVRWVRQGAEVTEHWAYLPLRTSPDEARTGAALSAVIDARIAEKLAEHGLNPNPRADRRTLIRRVSLDLIGLPPSPEQVEAFVNDAEPDAYDRLVNALLASPRFGEHWATWWLDAARYADSSGYQQDRRRDMWPYRDWVIRALNEDIPFDRFTAEQLAGDLLPEPTHDQLVATAFHRNTLTNHEDGIDPEEFRVAAVQDRVNTTMSAWMGVTMSCAQCHSHKYDPITHREYYELYAFFNQTQDANRQDEAPTLRTPTDAQTKAWHERVSAERAAFEVLSNAVEAHAQALQSWNVDAEHPGRVSASMRSAVAAARVSAAGIESEGFRWQTDKPRFVPAPTGRGVVFDDTGFLAWEGDKTVGDFRIDQSFSVALWVRPDAAHGPSNLVTRASPDGEAGPLSRGWAFMLRRGKPLFQLTGGQAGNRITVETQDPLVISGAWTHLAVSYDGSGKASGVVLMVDGVTVPVKVLADRFDTDITNDAQLQVGRQDGVISAAFTGAMADVVVVDGALSAAEVKNHVDASVRRDFDKDVNVETDGLPLFARLALLHVDTDLHDAWVRWRVRRYELEDTERFLPDLPIMAELPAEARRATHRFVRGDFLRPAEAVTPGTPAVFPRFDSGLPRSRLGLAQWLTDADNPLTARVQVNRVWERLMGRGIVETVEDFGIRGELPTHPELLDELAAGFVADEWSFKALIRAVVLSDTYRRSAVIDEAAFQADPENTLYARMSRLRLPAEVLRDSALTVSGLLSDQTGGPPFAPVLPDGHPRLTAAPAAAATMAGVDSPYRRSVYAVRQRSVDVALFNAYDAADPNTCVLRRRRSNTPIQALTTLNDPEFVAAAHALAQRAWSGTETNIQPSVAKVFSLAIGRVPTAEELVILTELYRRSYQAYQEDPQSAEHAIQKRSDLEDETVSSNHALVSSAEHTALMVVANAVLSTDAFLTRP